MYKELDPLLHSQLRLAIISFLVGIEEAEFNLLKEKNCASGGNLSVQIDKLNQAGYIEVEKKFRGKKPLTLCRLTKKGLKAFENYVNDLKIYIHPKQK
jgi:DNA-binding MarR family transcriptional regulator